MRMGSCLALRVNTRAGVLIEAGLFAETAVRMDGERGHTPSAIVSDEEHLAGFVHYQMAGTAACGINLVEKLERAGHGVYGITANKTMHTAIVADLRDGVEIAMAWIGDHEGGVLSLGRHAYGGHLSVAWVEAKGIDAFAGGTSIGTHVNKVGVGCSYALWGGTQSLGNVRQRKHEKHQEHPAYWSSLNRPSLTNHLSSSCCLWYSIAKLHRYLPRHLGYLCGEEGDPLLLTRGTGPDATTT